MLRFRKRRKSVATASARRRRPTADNQNSVQTHANLPLFTEIDVTIAAMTDFLTEKRREIEQRMNELRPLVDEYHQLEAATAALAGAKAPAAPGATRKRAAKAAPRAKAAAGTGKRGRPKGSGKRAQEVLDLVQATPGITIPELAKKIGIQQNYLYRVVPDLQKQGKVRKRKRGWYPA